MGLDWKQYVEVDNRYQRPTEVEALIGDPSYIRKKLGWVAKTHWGELADLMVDADLEALGLPNPKGTSSQDIATLRNIGQAATW